LIAKLTQLGHFWSKGWMNTKAAGEKKKLNLNELKFVNV
jgi:hypothetical protein